MREVYARIVQRKRLDTLEESIRHFLNAGNKNLGCRAEGLKHLRTQVMLVNAFMNVINSSSACRLHCVRHLENHGKENIIYVCSFTVF
jgi:hypothetical protein